LNLRPPERNYMRYACPANDYAARHRPPSRGGGRGGGCANPAGCKCLLGCRPAHQLAHVVWWLAMSTTGTMTGNSRPRWATVM
jgi:hypothetical protein